MAEAAKRIATRAHRRWESSAINLLRHRLGAAAASRVSPADFWYGRYPNTFLERRPPRDLGGERLLPRRLWVCWTGPNRMSDARQRGLERIRQVNPDVRIDLVTADNVSDFVVSGHPLHPAYEYLSYTHRSDYLRAYLLHHHGGAYGDIKPMYDSWSRHFDTLEQTDAWLMGPVVRSPYEVGANRGKLGGHLRRYHSRLITGGAIVARAHTPLTAEWMREVDRLMTYAAPALEEFPHDDQGHGLHPGYPLGWMELLGEILQPLLLKHHEYVVIDRDPWWDPRVEYR